MDTPHPGPAPQPLVIPEAEAAELGRAIDGLVGLLDQALSTHRQARRDDLATFTGPEHASIDHELERHIAGLERDLDALVGQRRQLDGFMSDAEAARAARHHAQRRWEQDLQQHLAGAGA